LAFSGDRPLGGNRWLPRRVVGRSKHDASKPPRCLSNARRHFVGLRRGRSLGSSRLDDEPALPPFPELADAQKQVESDKQKSIAQYASAAATGEGHAKSAKPRRRGPRNNFPEHLPRKVVRVELPADQRQTPCGGVMKEIGVEVTRKIERLSLSYIEETHQVKYACIAHPEEGVRTGAS
jgi:hypothetical protein